MKPEPRIAKALAKLEGMPTNDPRIRDKTIQEIAVLALERLDSLAPPSQGKVERAREILAAAILADDPSNGELSRMTRAGTGEQINPAIRVAIAAITQALTESSGQMDEEASAILRTLASAPDSADISETDAKVSVGLLRRLLASGQGTDGADRAGVPDDIKLPFQLHPTDKTMICDCQGDAIIDCHGAHLESRHFSRMLAAFVIERCNLPVSADGRDAAIEECARAVEHEALGAANSALSWRNKPCRDERDEQDFSRHERECTEEKNRLKKIADSLRALKSKQPSDTGGEK